MMTLPRRKIRAAAVTIAATVLSSLNFGCRRGPEPTLRGLDALLATKQFDAAERRLDDYLAAHPESARAHMLTAQVALNRDPQKPQVALDHLARIQSSDRPLLALVKLNEGKAHSALGDHARAEASWREALRIDPVVPEAGWALLSLYYVEGRRREAEQLGLALHAAEPDPRDRVQLLLELVRQDAMPIVPAHIIRALESGVREHPGDIHGTIGLARGYFGDSRHDEGIALLHRLVERHPDDPDARDALLRVLDDTARPLEFAENMVKLPASFTQEPQFARYFGIVAQNRRDWASSIKSLEIARRFNPLDSQALYRLGRAFRLAGREAEAKQAEAEFRAFEATLREMLPLYDEANATKGFGILPTPDLYRRIAEARERLGYRAEALAWYRLVLRDRPDDPAGLEAVKRLADAKLPTLADVLADESR